MRNHYPAIDILASISRLMSSIVEPAHRLAAGKVRNMMSVYQQNQDLLLIGLIFLLALEGADDDILFILIALLFISS